MSSTVLFGAPEGGTFRKIASFGNSWGGAAFVWYALSERYLGDKTAWMNGRVEELWALAEDVRLQPFERDTLLSTFDRALVRSDGFSCLAASFRTFVAAYPPGEYVCHLMAQADFLDSLAHGDGDLCFVPHAVGWQQTTVGENLWNVRIGEDDTRPYDLARDTGHFFLFQKEPEMEPNQEFTCPKCGSHYFGRDISPDGIPLETVHCNGQSSDGPTTCDWQGPWPQKDNKLPPA
ncbi:MAG: hypothetical protein KGL39_35800 [Patescibacteria group bacterium]|nr:hypothetical protein [Patescibacteria group bacterium]